MVNFNKNDYLKIRQEVLKALLKNLEVNETFDMEKLTTLIFAIVFSGVIEPLNQYIIDNKIDIDQRVDVLYSHNFKRYLWKDDDQMFFFLIDFSLSIIIYNQSFKDYEKFKNEHFIK